MKKSNSGWVPLLKTYPESKKINSVSFAAEALFTRLLTKCDDSGNYDARPAVIMCHLYSEKFAAGSITVENIADMLNELVTSQLVIIYQNGQENCLHIVDYFTTSRSDVKPDIRYPAYSQDNKPQVFIECVTNAGRMRNECETETARYNKNNNKNNNKKENKKENIALTPSEFSFVLKNGNLWNLPEEKVLEYEQTYQNINVEQELLKAAQWLKDNQGKRKTQTGMLRFINSWLSRCTPAGQSESLDYFPTAEEAEALLRSVFTEKEWEKEKAKEMKRREAKEQARLLMAVNQ